MSCSQPSTRRKSQISHEIMIFLESIRDLRLQGKQMNYSSPRTFLEYETEALRHVGKGRNIFPSTFSGKYTPFRGMGRSQRDCSSVRGRNSLGPMITHSYKVEFYYYRGKGRKLQPKTSHRFEVDWLAV